MNKSDIAAMAKGMADPIRDFVAQEITKAVGPLQKRLSALEFEREQREIRQRHERAK